MKKHRTDIFLYLCSLIISLTTLLYLNLTPKIAEDLDYRVSTTIFSTVWYTNFLFLAPLLYKILLREYDPNGNYSKLFWIQYIIAVLTVVLLIYILLDQSIVKSRKEDFAINKDSDSYFFVALLKILTYLFSVLIVIKSIVRFTMFKMRKIN